MMAGLLVTSILSGNLISRYGHYRPFPIAGTAIATVGLFLLSQIGVTTSTGYVAVGMVVLGLGLGMTMQVLVLAVQNAVDYRYLGVATSGSTLFRQIGGSIGVSAFGAIFSNNLSHELASRIPRSVHVPTAANPAVVSHLPPAIKAPYIAAFCRGAPAGVRDRRGRRARGVPAQLAAARGAAAPDRGAPRGWARASPRLATTAPSRRSSES